MRPWRRWRVWHKKRSRTYAWANSFWGTLHAKRQGCNAADRDLRFTVDRVPVVTHEGLGVHEFPGDPDPRRMTWRQVTRGKVPAGWWAVLDDAKGPARHTRSRPENKPARVSGRVA